MQTIEHSNAIDTDIYMDTDTYIHSHTKVLSHKKAYMLTQRSSHTPHTHIHVYALTNTRAGKIDK